MSTADLDIKEVAEDFAKAVNMTPAALRKWLQTPESKEVGWTQDGDRESVGHRSCRRIVEILETKKADLTQADYRHMRKVVGYVHRHMAQRPSGSVEDTRWRHSLMNWGHDPLKK